MSDVMMQIKIEQIKSAPNGKALNALLPEGVAVVNRGRSNRASGQWAFTVGGDCQQTGDFSDIKAAAAQWMTE